MEFQEAINKGFELYEEVENQICLLSRIDARYTDVSYSDGILKIKTDWTVKNVEADIEITRDEIISKVIDEDIEPKEAICELLTKKVVLSAREF